jgi:hypothetical protein
LADIFCGNPEKAQQSLLAENIKRGKIMDRVKTIDYHCSWDNSLQKAQCFIAAGNEPRPLLVALHTWSFTYEQDCASYAQYCIKNNWNFIFPDFRGPNWTPEACGSDAVVEDIADAVAYMKQAAIVDNDRVYLMGGSGGAFLTLGGAIAYFMFRNGLNSMNVSSGYYLVLTGLILIVIVAFERIKGLKRAKK